MIRFIPVDELDIIADPEEVGDMLAQAVRRRIPMRLTSFCRAGEGSFFAVLEQTAEAVPMEFVFSPFTDCTFDTMTAEISQRYESGYTTVATFPVGSEMWGLFQREDAGK